MLVFTLNPCKMHYEQVALRGNRIWTWAAEGKTSLTPRHSLNAFEEPCPIRTLELGIDVIELTKSFQIRTVVLTIWDFPATPMLTESGKCSNCTIINQNTVAKLKRGLSMLLSILQSEK